MIDLRDLTGQFPVAGRVDRILLRPSRDAAAIDVDEVEAQEGRGLVGDRSAARAAAVGSKRQVTLLQAEHLPLIAAWSGLATLDAAILRRNLVVSGINLIATRSPFADRPMQVRIGDAVRLWVTGDCAPCSKMEDRLGRGAYNALRGHGGVTARVMAGGRIRIGDAVTIEPVRRPDP
jgi:MOSC domain-containing protein YiiM